MKQFMHTIFIKTCGGLLAVFGTASLVAVASYDKSNTSINTAGNSVYSAIEVLQTWSDILVQFFGISGIFISIMCIIWGIKIIKGQYITNLAMRRNTLIIGTICLLIGMRYFQIPLWNITETPNIYAHGVIGHILYTYSLAFADTYAVWGAYGLIAISIPLLLYTLAITGTEWKGVKKAITQIIKKILVSIYTYTVWAKQKLFPSSKHYTDPKLDALQDAFSENKSPAPDVDSPITADMFTENTKQVVKKKPAKKIIQPTQAETFQLPTLDLLEDVKTQSNAVSESELQKTREYLEKALDDFNVKGNIAGVRLGPVVTTYELELDAGVRENRVIGLADDIARTMGAESIRISRIPGKTFIGIELPNIVRETVSFKDIVGSKDFLNTDMALPLALGRDVEGSVAITDLASMPHLLIAGTTGSGKSVGINAMILSLLYRYPPDALKMIMVDPKMLEFSMYEGIPHLLSPVVTEPHKAVVALKWAVNEMNRRYAQMSKMGVRNITGYNDKIATLKKSGDIPMETINTGFDEHGNPIYEEQPQELEHYPYIVVIVDEMADLMLSAGKDINDSIQSLAQKARAAGIHIILATQRPSTDVITGTIRANFPARISYRVTSKIDSRVILNESGAEQLLGRGDMLFFTTKITRNHAPFVQDQEVERVCDWLRAQETPEYVDAVTDTNTLDDENAGNIDGSAFSNTDKDALYDEAVALVTTSRKASTSFIQRSLKIGYNRAANLIEELEADGVVSPATQTGKRTVLAPERDYD